MHPQLSKSEHVYVHSVVLILSRLSLSTNKLIQLISICHTNK
jgi:hypothetical protein